MGAPELEEECVRIEGGAATDDSLWKERTGDWDQSTKKINNRELLAASPSRLSRIRMSLSTILLQQVYNTEVGQEADSCFFH